jgi:putative zinc finger/helix-turn-helix YgiT family protein
VKGETVHFKADALVCDSCGGHYWDTELGDRLAKAASNAYRAEHGLLTSDQIVAYRKKLNMSQAEFAKFLPMAIASLKRYESFGVQDESADALIRLRCDRDQQARASRELKLLQAR